ncbi:MAG: hypothetical protein D6776_05765, partial [Planctomycetota bacterium]
REQLVLGAPVVYEKGRGKADADGLAPVFAELLLQRDGALVWRIGIPARWLAEPARRYPVVIDPVLSRNVPVVVNTDPTAITVSPRAVYWNAVAVSSANADWDLDIGAASSWAWPPDADFLVANGNKGTISPVTGSVSRFGSSTGSATVEQAGIDSLSLGTDTSYTWTASHVIHLWELYVSSGRTGSHDLAVDAPAGMRWAVFRPGTDASWKSVSAADYVFDADGRSHTLQLNESGFWAVVLVKDGGPGASGTVTFRWGGAQQGGFDLIATSVSLDASSYPVTLRPGDRFSFTREITRQGSQPPGTQIDYAIYLSSNTLITQYDWEAYSYQNAGAGRLSLSATVPPGIPPGTYYVGLLVKTVAGEASTSNNTTYDAVAGHRVVVTGANAQIALTQGVAAVATSSPTDFTFTPRTGYWNVVAARSSAAWELEIGGVRSARGAGATDLLFANGNLGAVSPASGTLRRTSGSADATLLHTDQSVVPSATGQASRAWAASDIAYGWDHLVQTTGTRRVVVDGPAGLRWALLPPGQGPDWRTLSAARYDFPVGATPRSVDLNVAGWWLFVVYRSAAGPAGTVRIDVQRQQPPSFDVAVGSVVLGGQSFPVSVAPGGQIDVTRRIDVTGTLPQGSAISYHVYLSTDTNFDANDTEIYHYSPAAAGTLQLRLTVPATVAPGDYHVGVVIDPIPGEQNPNNNVRGEDAGHQVRVQQPQPVFNVAAAAVSVAGGPVTLAPGGAFTAQRTVQVSGRLPGNGSYTYRYYLSADRTLDPRQDVLVGSGQSSQPSGAATDALAVPASTAAGRYYLILSVDPIPGESQTNDNVVASAAADVVVNAPPAGFNIEARAVTVQGQPPVSVQPGGTFSVDRTTVVTGTQSRRFALKLYLSTDAQLDPGTDIEVLAGSQTQAPGSLRSTDLVRLPANIAPGTYHVILWLETLAGESNTNDNVLATAQPEVTVGNPPPATLALTLGQPAVVQASRSFTLQPQAGRWNVVAVAADVATEDWDVEVGNGYSAELPPTTDFVLADGHAGAIAVSSGDALRYSGAGSARVEHADLHATSLGQSAQANWAAGDVALVFEVDVQQPGVHNVVLDGPQGLGWAVFPPAPGAFWFDRTAATATFAVGPAAQQVDFATAGVWAIVVWADAGPPPGPGVVRLDWAGSGSGGGTGSGFDLAAGQVAVNVTGNAVLAPGDTIDVEIEVRNLGANASPLYVYAVYLSTDTTIDPSSDVRAFESVSSGTVAAGATERFVQTVTVPSGIAAGRYYVGVLVPALTGDTDPSNQSAVSASRIEIATQGSGGGAVTGGGGASGITRARSGGGGGCALSPEQPASGGIVWLLVAAALVGLRLRRVHG